jgi:hypothetical protein
MNTTDDSTRSDTAGSRAEAGTTAWEDAVRLQRWATPDHADFYVLAGEMVATLSALDDLAYMVGRQVAGYAAAQQARGRRVYDDTRQIDPMVRLASAVEALAEGREALSVATRSVNEFWSAVGHIGTEDDIEHEAAAGAGDRTEPVGGGEVGR